MHHTQTHIAMVSADWNQCLAPCGPFDAIAFRYPQLRAELDRVFQSYTANTITLTAAVSRVQAIVPAPLTEEDMDAYIDTRQDIYPGVIDLIHWCASNHILFMINTTGPMGYFQRLRVKRILPALSALSAHPVIRFESASDESWLIYELTEITDKGSHTAAAAKRFNIAPQKVIVIGDSGGDGPHFEWAAASGATAISSMAKPSLLRYCAERSIPIHHRFGYTYSEGEPISVTREKRYDFRHLAVPIRQILNV